MEMNTGSVDDEAAKASYGMSTRILLARHGLEEYTVLMERAGYKMLDGSLRFSDVQVERLLSDVEVRCNIKFLPEVRNRLWKAFRIAWSQGAGHKKRSYIAKTQIPSLFLPKRYYVPVDQMLNLDDLDPDRRRQILRKKAQSPAAFDASGGPQLQTLQFEVYKRKQDLFYVYKDLQRSVDQWVKLNPMGMLREDRREDVLKCRIDRVMNAASELLQQRKSRFEWTVLIKKVLYFVCSCYLAMSVLMVAAAFYAYRASPFRVMLEFALGSKQLVCSLSYLMAGAVVYAIAIRAHLDPTMTRMNKMLVGCEALKEMIDEFRIESVDQRMRKEELRMRELKWRAALLQTASIGIETEESQDVVEEVRKRKPKKKKEGERQVDRAMMLWAPTFEKGDAPFDHQQIMADIDQSYAELMHLNTKPSGDRNAKYQRERPNMNEWCRLGNKKNKQTSLGFHLPVEEMPRLEFPDLPPLPPPSFEDVRPPRLPQVPPPPRKVTNKMLGVPPGPKLPAPPKEPLRVELTHSQLGSCFVEKMLSENVEGWTDCNLLLTGIPEILLGVTFFAGPHGTLPEGDLTLSSTEAGTAYIWCDIESDGGVPAQCFELFGTMNWGSVGRTLEIYAFDIGPGICTKTWPVTGGWLGAVAFKPEQKARSTPRKNANPKAQTRTKSSISAEDSGEEREEVEQELDEEEEQELDETGEQEDGDAKVVGSDMPDTEATVTGEKMTSTAHVVPDEGSSSSEECASPTQPLLPNQVG